MAVKKDKKAVGEVQAVWGITCSLSSVDEKSNNVSLFNVIEQLNVPAKAFEQAKEEKKPMMIPHQHELIVLFRRTIPVLSTTADSIPVDLKISLIDPDGKELMENLTSFKFPNVRRFRNRHYSLGFLITKPGDYVYRVQIKESGQDSFGSPYEVPLDIQSV